MHLFTSIFEMKKLAAWWLAGVIGLVLALELLFRVLPVSTSTETGYYTDPLILTYPSHHRWNTSTGWDLRNAQTVEANNLGYVASRDFVRNEQAVALIGDSFIEASMLPAADRPGAQLERALGTRPVYAMGNPGTSLLDYAERIRYAHERFGTRDFVVLMERGDVQQSLCGSGNVNGACLDPKTLALRNDTLPAPDVVKRIVRRSALAQYLVSQLKFSAQKIWRPTAGTQTGASVSTLPARASSSSPSAMPEVDAVTQAFFKRVKPHISGRLVIVVDSDRIALNRGQKPSDPARDRFIQLARAAEVIVIDTEPLFREHLTRSSLKLEIGPYDSHFNRLGVSLFVRAVAGVLNEP